MKIKLIFGRTDYDPETTWATLKSCEVEVPDYLAGTNGCSRYHLIGAIMPDGYDD